MSFLFALSVKGNWIMSRFMTVSSKSRFLQFERWFFNCDILRSAWPWCVSRSECQGYNRAAANTTQPGTGTSWSGPKLPGKLVHREQQQQQAWCGLQSAWCMRVTRRMTASYEQHQHINPSLWCVVAMTLPGACTLKKEHTLVSLLAACCAFCFCVLAFCGLGVCAFFISLSPYLSSAGP